MSASPVRSVPVACVPDAIPREQRAAHFELAKHLFEELAEGREPLAEGYAFRFPPDAISSIAHFVDNERRCCPFMQFEIAVSPDVGPVWLRMSGPEGTRAVLDAELGLNRCTSRGCGCNGG